MRSRARIAFAASLAGLFFTFSSTAALAQSIVREAPKDVKPARMVITAPPEITINGVADRLSPGARIRDLNNMLVLSGSVVGQDIPVVYRREAAGMVHEVWVLTPAEWAKVGGINTDSASGYVKFAELLALVFSLRK